MKTSMDGHRPLPTHEFPRWAKGTWFSPSDQAAHERASEGHDVTDSCSNCGLDFMHHVNAMCPK